MRVVMSVVCAVWLGGASGCGSDAKAESVDGTLVLQLGGSQPSLRDALRKRGIVIEPAAEAAPHAPVPRSEPPPLLPPPQRPPAPPPAAEPQPEPVAPPQPKWFTVNLAKGETLTVLARRHLGDGNRYREIQQLNGWSDWQVKRLPVGQEVRIPNQR
jgi:nucleoid-associated protein YgaU